MEKPVVKLIGEDGNIFNIIAIASKALKRANQPEKAKEMFDRVTKCMSYDMALATVLEYVDAE